MTGMANQSGTKRYISYCVTAKNHIIHMGTRTSPNVYISGSQTGGICNSSRGNAKPKPQCGSALLFLWHKY